MATSKLVAGLVLALTSLLALATADFVHDRPMHRIRRQSPTTNVHEIPKTSFSCADKQSGEYYADPEVQCQVYHICVPGVTGKLAKMSFVCPNGTIFSQSSRVCSTYDRVYCPLAERFYENVMGEIDTDKEYYHSMHVDAPVFNAIVPPYDEGRQEKRRRPVRPVVEYDDDADYDATTAAPPSPTSTQRRRTQQQQSTQSSARRFQPSQRSQFSRGGSRTQSTTTAPTTTTTTTQRPPAPAFRPSPFRNTVNRGPPQSFTQPPTQTVPTFGTVAPAVVQPNPFSQPPARTSFVPAALVPANPVSGGGTPPVAPPPIPNNAVASGAVVQQTAPPTLPPQQQNPGSQFRLPQRPHLRRPGASLATTTTTPPPSTAEYEYYDYEEEAKTAAPRSKRAAAVPVKFILPPNTHASVAQTSFSCQDKVAGGVYADPETDCQLFHICVPIGKGKLLDYGLLCDEGTAFNQETGTCDERDSFSCARSLQFTRTDKTKKFLADKKPWAYPKFNKRVVRDVRAQEEVESRSAEVREHGEEEGLLVAAVELPVTSFTCEGKTVGGYYADVETGCRMFHICAQTDMRFLCTNGTVFDQKALVCKNEDEVRCEDSPKHYVNGLTRFLEREKLRPEEEAREQRRADAYEITKVKGKYPKKVGDYKLRRYL